MKKNIQTALLGLAIALAAATTGCDSPIQPPRASAPQTGNGTARIDLGAAPGTARTALPQASGFYYLLTFSAGDATKTAELGEGTALEVELPPGTWSLTVKGYADQDAARADAAGTACGLIGSAENIAISAGATTPVTVSLSAAQTWDGMGELVYDFSFPRGTTPARMSFVPLVVGELGADTTVPDVNLLVGSTNSGGITRSKGTVTLPSGYYRVTLALTCNTVTVEKSLAVHIFNGLPASTGETFSAGDFVVSKGALYAGEAFVDLNVASWQSWDNILLKSLDYIKANAVSNAEQGIKDYIIVLGEDITIDQTIRLSSVTAGGIKTPERNSGYDVAPPTGVTITLKGDGQERIIQLDPDYKGRLFNIRDKDNLTLILEDGVTLRGHDHNDRVLVNVGFRWEEVYDWGTGGRLVMKPGSKITGNINTTVASYYPWDFVGGVFVDRDAIFEMEGGEISGNQGKIAGGVCLAGAFTMSGGTIGGNTGFDDGEYTYSSAIRGAAGGVFIAFMSGSGTIFTKTGGVIYGKVEDRPVNNEAVGDVRRKGHAVYWDKPNTTAGLWINGDHTGGNLDASDESSGWDPQVTGVTVSSPVISAAQGDNVQFASTVDWYREGSRDVTWQLNGVDSPGATSGGSSIGASGLLSVGANETAPTLTVTAVSVADPLMSGSTSISVIPPVVARTSAGLYIGNASTPVNSTGSLAAALAYIRSNAVSDTSYTIVLGGNETVSTLITLDDAAVNNAQRVGVTLEGLQTERTITATNRYRSIFEVRSSITLTLGNNITLKGMTNGVDGATEDSYNPVVVLLYGGKLVMLEGSKITGNTYTSTTHSNGAGVTVGTYGDAAGTFEMRGGEISGNTITSIWGAGGVYVKAGTFVMSGGVIRGNTATNNYSSGGVAVGSPALAVFEKTGGIIYGVNPERAGYNAADNNTATGTGTKANAVLWEDSSSVQHSIDGDLAGNFPLE